MVQDGVQKSVGKVYGHSREEWAKPDLDFLACSELSKLRQYRQNIQIRVSSYVQKFASR